jgi:hypothetical protein
MRMTLSLPVRLKPDTTTMLKPRHNSMFKPDATTAMLGRTPQPRWEAGRNNHNAEACREDNQIRSLMSETAAASDVAML